jgi:hypothetical protein
MANVCAEMHTEATSIAEDLDDSAVVIARKNAGVLGLAVQHIQTNANQVVDSMAVERKYWLRGVLENQLTDLVIDGEILASWSLLHDEQHDTYLIVAGLAYLLVVLATGAFNALVDEYKLPD